MMSRFLLGCPLSSLSWESLTPLFNDNWKVGINYHIPDQLLLAVNSRCKVTPLGSPSGIWANVREIISCKSDLETSSGCLEMTQSTKSPVLGICNKIPPQKMMSSLLLLLWSWSISTQLDCCPVCTTFNLSWLFSSRNVNLLSSSSLKSSNKLLSVPWNTPVMPPVPTHISACSNVAALNLPMDL